MKCVVTGATGHIGNVLVRKLVEKGYEVTAFVRNTEKAEYLKNLDIKFAYGDVRNIESLERAFNGAEIVFHLAGIIDIGNGNKKTMYEVNVEGSKNVVKACKKMNVRRLVYTSSVHAIKEKKKGEIITETKEFSKDWVKGTYAKTKAEATQYMLSQIGDKLEIIVTQPSGVIGPYEYIISNLGQLIIDCANKKIGAYIEGGYNFVDVRDVVDGLIKAGEKGRNGECYILSGQFVSIKQLMQYVQDITGVEAPKFKIARWFAYATGFLSELYYKIAKEKPLFTSYAVYTTGTNSNFSNEKAIKELGYKVTDIKDTIRDTVYWFESQGKIKLNKNDKRKE